MQGPIDWTPPREWGNISRCHGGQNMKGERENRENVKKNGRKEEGKERKGKELEKKV